MSTPDRLLLCCDLDRTLLPNGLQPESAEARPLLRRLAALPQVTLAYVSGRHRALLEAAIEEYALPMPDFAVGDVGSTVYHIGADRWRHDTDWETEIAPDWAGMSHKQIADALADIDGLRLQESEKQNTFKLSYYTAQSPPEALLEQVDRRLEPLGVRAELIWSVDEAAKVGLLDILPRGATKLHAVRFLMRIGGFDVRETIFAGDSGNDLAVLTSGLQAVLVANATDAVRRAALGAVADGPHTDRLYFAQGGFHGMNGNYAAGVLEGVVHFLPSARRWLE